MSGAFRWETLRQAPRHPRSSPTKSTEPWRFAPALIGMWSRGHTTSRLNFGLLMNRRPSFQSNAGRGRQQVGVEITYDLKRVRRPRWALIQSIETHRLSPCQDRISRSGMMAGHFPDRPGMGAGNLFRVGMRRYARGCESPGPAGMVPDYCAPCARCRDCPVHRQPVEPPGPRSRVRSRPDSN